MEKRARKVFAKGRGPLRRTKETNTKYCPGSKEEGALRKYYGTVVYYPFYD